ncbi:DUF6785 family protein [Candidatus Poribacteria bacterium]
MTRTGSPAMEEQHTARVTTRSVVLALILVPFNSYWILYMSYVWDSNRPTSLSLLFNAIFVLLVLIAANTGLRRLSPRLELSQTELLTVYCILCQASAFAGRDMIQVLMPLMGHGVWYATPENEWSELFHRYLPNWLSVGNRTVLRGFYEGDSTLYLSSHIRAWLTPVLIWAGFGAVLGFTMLCLNVMVRKQWQEHEKLTYPIAQLPLEMTRMKDRVSFFRNRSMWVAVGIAGLVNLMHSLHQIFPSMPEVNLYTRIRLLEKPWSAMDYPGFRFGFFPFAIGLGFLIPLDLGFSCWFFHQFWHFQRLVGGLTGWNAFGFPREMEQVRGVWVSLLVIVIWRGRKHFGRVLRSVFRYENDMYDMGEALRYRTAILGVFAGFLLILFFCTQAGMSWWMAAAFFGIYLCMSLAITRIRAELGPPSHDLYNAGPDLILTDFFGTRRLGMQNLSVMTLFFWINHLSYRAHPMPHQLEALKLAHQTHFDRRRLLFVLVIAIVVGMLSASWGYLHISYSMGQEHGRSWYAKAGFDRLAQWGGQPQVYDPAGIFFTLGGFLFSVGLQIMRMRFLWWPLHPVGYLISSWTTFAGLWFSIFISWTIKFLLLRYRGVRGYRQAVPFFLGLVLGDVMVTSIISILGLFFGFRVVYLRW